MVDKSYYLGRPNFCNNPFYFIGVISVVCLLLFTNAFGIFVKNTTYTVLFSYVVLSFALRTAMLIFGCFNELCALLNKTNKTDTQTISEYSVYTILLPVYKENKIILARLIKSISNLDYPSDKKDVKLILEANDIETINIINELQSNGDIPSYFDVIIIPDVSPKTKPKACNYAMHFTNPNSKYTTIYDAEDVPEIDQLIKAVKLFEKDSKIQCLQAELCCINKDQNILTWFFALEYMMWFRFIMRGMIRLGMPITLGGTSNHIRTATLKHLGLWSANNVTEDAELGIRLATNGMKVEHLNSKTFEECPSSLGNFFNQRVRWCKGFKQTYFFYFKKFPLFPTSESHSKLGARHIINFAIFHIFHSFSAMGFILTYLTIGTQIVISHLYATEYIPTSWFIQSMFSLGYWLIAVNVFTTLLLLCVTKDFNFKKMTLVLCMPLYFFIHFCASIKSIVDLILKPSYWNKTAHHGTYNSPR